jgi:hypothetical protein
MANETLYYIYLSLIVIGVLILYMKYQEKFHENRVHIDRLPDDLEMISEYYYKNTAEKLQTEIKPILWIHLPYEYNSRHWSSFGSRSSFNLNQPYLYITLKSIIMKCDDTFHVCIIDDTSFARLLYGWKVDMKLLSDPMKQYMRQLGICQLLYKYGGMNLPISFLCMKNIYYIWDRGTTKSQVFTIETVNRDASKEENTFKPNIKFLGAVKGSETMKKLIHYIEYEISRDYTDQMKFLGKMNNYLTEEIQKHNVYMFDSGYIGAKTMSGSAVLIDTLMSSDFIELTDTCHGIYIDMYDLLNRTKYEYFPRMSMRQVCEGTSILSKYMLLSCTEASSRSLDIKKELVNDNNETKRKIWDTMHKYVKLWQLNGVGNLGETIYGLMPNRIFPRH